MNGCERFREELPAWVDGELTGSAAEAMAAHVESCGACRAEVEGLRKADRALLAALGGELAARPGWVEQVEARILRQAGARPAGRVIRVSWIAAAVAAAVLGALGLGLALRAPRAAETAHQVKSDRPAPRPAEPAPLPGQPTPDPRLVEEVADALEELPLEEILPPRPEGHAPTPPDAAAEAPEGLDAEDLDLLAFLADGEDVDLAEALELLQDLAPEELDEG